MRSLKDHISCVLELVRQHEIATYRHYIRDSQAILLELIVREIESLPSVDFIPEDLYLTLSDPKKLITNNIEVLCELYKRVVLLNTKIG